MWPESNDTDSSTVCVTYYLNIYKNLVVKLVLKNI